MSLLDVKHQPQAQRFIQRAVARDRLPHAHIFHGPDGVGKELFARGLAQLLLCQQPIEQTLSADQTTAVGLDTLRVGCGQCDDCRLVANGMHPDWHLIYRQLNRDHPDPEVRRRKGLDIGVDVLRHFVIEKVGHTPMRARAKMFVIREADRITTQAQNALLKTLEEPPGTTFIILLVRSLERLLPTTLSRCRLVGFDALPTAFVRAEIAHHLPELPPEQLDWYARVSQGSVGLAIEAARDELFDVNGRLLPTLAPTAGAMNSAEVVKRWTDLAGELGSRFRERDPAITDTEATRRGLKAVLHLAAAWYADVLRVGAEPSGGKVELLRCKETPEDLPESADETMSLFASATAPTANDEPSAANADPLTPLNAAWTAVLRQTASNISDKAAIDAVNRIARAERQLDLNANTQLVVETLLNELGHINTGERLAAV